MRITRSRVLVVVLLLGVVAGLEALALAGRFDHFHRVRGEEGPRFQSALARAPASGISVVHVGHSTHYLAVDGVRLLTDPWFYDPAGGALVHGRGPIVAPEEISPIDAVLITHDHPDHADPRALGRIEKTAHVLCPTPELATMARKNGFDHVSVLAAWERYPLRDVVVVAVPAKHDVPEIGFVIVGKSSAVYFAGDSALHDDLEAIAVRLHPDVAILPMDGTRYRGRARSTMSPEDAVKAAKTLGVKLVLTSHADALFHDPFARHVVVAETEDNGRARFHALVREDLPGVRVETLFPGDLAVY